MLPRLLGKSIEFWCGDCPGPSCGLAGGRRNECQRGLIYEQRPTESYLKWYFDQTCGYKAAGELVKLSCRYKAFVPVFVSLVCV